MGDLVCEVCARSTIGLPVAMPDVVLEPTNDDVQDSPQLAVAA
jgi:hypothetical protein